MQQSSPALIGLRLHLWFNDGTALVTGRSRFVLGWICTETAPESIVGITEIAFIRHRPRVSLPFRVHFMISPEASTCHSLLIQFVMGSMKSP